MNIIHGAIIFVRLLSIRFTLPIQLRLGARKLRRSAASPFDRLDACLFLTWALAQALGLAGFEIACGAGAHAEPDRPQHGGQ